MISGRARTTGAANRTFCDAVAGLLPRLYEVPEWYAGGDRLQRLLPREAAYVGAAETGSSALLAAELVAETRGWPMREGVRA